MAMRDFTASQSAPPPPVSRNGGGEEPRIRQTAGGPRKKGALVRSWLVVESKGQAEVVEAGKHAIMQRTGLPARDLRVLDPALSYPSTILGRERAIVVNLEHIRSIITSQEMIFQNSKDPFLTSFVQKIQGIFRHRQAVMSTQESGGDGNSEGVWTNFYNSEEPQSMVDGRDHIYTGRPTNEPTNEEGNADVGDNAAHRLKLLPFEFVALETCLEVTCSSLDDEARRLEQEAYPALDKLTSKISTLNLDQVRNIKSRLVSITGRVQKVRDELEHLLDDDKDMAEMYLTEKLEERQLEDSSTSSMNEVDIIDEGVAQPEEDNRTDVEIMMGLDSSHPGASDIDLPKAEQLMRQRSNVSDAASMQSSSTKDVDVEELEMILEAYFVQIEGTLNKLSALREYVDDTEDYINIMLDGKQNHLLQMGVMLTTATVVVSAFVAMTGVFGMNVGIELFNEMPEGNPKFLWTVAGGTLGCIFCYVVAIAWCKHQRLLQ